MNNEELPFIETGKIIDFQIKQDHIFIGINYDSGGTQYGSFPLYDRLKILFPVGEKVTALFDSPHPYRGRTIKGLINSHNEDYVIDPVWEKEHSDKRRKEYEEYQKKQRERMLAIPRYRYESKYQFPDDVNIYGGNLKEDGEGYRNCAHLSVSRGMEFLEDKNPDDFIQLEYKNVKGITEDNKNVDKLKDHINKCVIKELGREWGHSGMTMILAAGNALEARKRGWDNYIQWVRTWGKEDLK